jgi:hypothetical protein
MWTATGSLTTPRRVHTATLLPSGKVLVAGGGNGLISTSSAELYDPGTGMWTATGSLMTPRRVHTATLLPSGEVLVAGGGNGSSILSSAELYDSGTPPTISAVAVTQTAGAGGYNSQIATVNDAEDAKNMLSVTVNGGASAYTNGVTVYNITVDAMGVVKAVILAACGATSADFTLRVTDSGGLFAEATLSVTVNPDNWPPAVTCPANVVVNLPPNTMATGMFVNYPAPTATDNCSTPAITTSIDSDSFFSVGSTTVNVTATDGAGNTATCPFTVTVHYNFSGTFFPPVDNPPTVNKVKAGGTVPINFSLSGNKGLNILAPGYPISQQIDCVSHATVGNTEPTVTPGLSSLSYVPTTDTYTYPWKTDKTWAGTCRQLMVKMNDGTVYVLIFVFQ